VTRPLAIALVLATTPALAADGMPRNGFWMEAKAAATATVATTSGGMGFITAPVLLPTLTLGARLVGRLQLGLGFSFYRVSTGGGAPANSLLFTPNVEVDLVKAADDRVAFFLGAGLGFGATIQTGANLFVIGYDAALGVRYAPHPMFAASVEGGIQGYFLDPNGTRGAGVTAVFGALAGNFYYGK
jgi:hypothetical protein